MRHFAHTALLALSIVALLALPAGTSGAQEDPFSSFDHTPNMTPVGASLRPATSQFNSDIAFQGDLAFQGSYAGFRIIDVSVPTAPEVVSETECSGNQGDVIVYGDVLVRSWNSLAAQSSCDGQPVIAFEGIHIFDITDPADPVLVGSQFLPCGSHTASGVPDPDNDRLLVYNSASSSVCPWNEIIEIPLDDPGSPRLLGLSLTGRSCHDTAIILGDAMLKACAGGNGFTVHSLGGERGGSLEQPLELFRVTVPSSTIGHAASFSWDGEVVIFGHEPGGGGSPRCREQDAPELKSVFFYSTVDGAELGRWTLPRSQLSTENCTIHNFNTVPTTDGSRVLVGGNYQSGIMVVDFTDPANATEVAFADPAPLAETLVLGGDWSSHWYDGLIYQSDITRGLLIWELDYAPVSTALELGRLNPQTQEFTITDGVASNATAAS